MSDIEYYAFVCASLVVLKSTMKEGTKTTEELEAVIKETEVRLAKAI